MHIAIRCPGGALPSSPVAAYYLPLTWYPVAVEDGTTLILDPGRSGNEAHHFQKDRNSYASEVRTVYKMPCGALLH